MSQCIIYALKNTVNSKVYVGQTWSSLDNRWNNGHGYDGSQYLSHAIKKHGRDKFYYEVLGLTSNQEVADYLETYFIEEFGSLDRSKGYNLKEGGSNGKHSPETKRFLSLIRKGTKLGNENTFYGKHHTDETKQKVSKAKRTFSDRVELEILQEYNNSNFSMKKMASKYNVSVKVIFNIVNRGRDEQLHQGRRHQRDPGSGRFCSIKK